MLRVKAEPQLPGGLKPLIKSTQTNIQGDLGPVGHTYNPEAGLQDGASRYSVGRACLNNACVYMYDITTY